MAMARDPGHGDLAFLHSSVFHFLSSLLLHTSIYLTISRIAFISLLLFRDLSLVLSSLAPLAPGLLLKTATAIRYLVTGYEPSAVTATKNLYKTVRSRRSSQPLSRSRVKRRLKKTQAIRAGAGHIEALFSTFSRFTLHELR